jgi:hypothetical protein
MVRLELQALPIGGFGIGQLVLVPQPLDAAAATSALSDFIRKRGPDPTDILSRPRTKKSKILPGVAQANPICPSFVGWIIALHAIVFPATHRATDKGTWWLVAKRQVATARAREPCFH